MDLGDDGSIGIGQTQPVDFGPAHYTKGSCPIEHRLLTSTLNGWLNRGEYLHTGGAPVRVPGENQICAPGKGSANGIKGFPAHENRTPHGGALEVLQIIGKIPRKGVSLPDHAVFRHRKYQLDRELLRHRICHTATGAGMWLWGS